MAKKAKIEKSVSIRNKKASFEYEFLDEYMAGIVLKGTEIKSIRQSKVNMQDAYCILQKDEIWIKNLHISEYERGNIHNHEPKADRKLLLTKREINKIRVKLQDNGVTIVPTRIFINSKGLAKVNIAVARGKKLYDKRQSIKEKEMKRSIERY